MFAKALDLISLFGGPFSCIVARGGAFGGNFWMLCVGFRLTGILPLSFGDAPTMSLTSLVLLLVAGDLLSLAALPSISPRATMCLLL
jgi:hypothetical protein